MFSRMKYSRWRQTLTMTRDIVFQQHWHSLEHQSTFPKIKPQYRCILRLSVLAEMSSNKGFLVSQYAARDAKHIWIVIIRFQEMNMFAVFAKGEMSSQFIFMWQKRFHNSKVITRRWSRYRLFLRYQINNIYLQLQIRPVFQTSC